MHYVSYLETTESLKCSMGKEENQTLKAVASAWSAILRIEEWSKQQEILQANKKKLIQALKEKRMIWKTYRRAGGIVG